MAELASFVLKQCEDIPLIEASGELDISNVDDFEAPFAEAAAAAPGGVVISLREVRYFDSRTVRTLGVFATRLAAGGRPLCVVLPKVASARLIFDMSGTGTLMHVADALEDALALARSHARRARG